MFGTRRIAPLEINGLDIATSGHAFAVSLAFVEIDLVAVVNRLLGSNLNTGVAAGTGFQVYGVDLAP